jgi:hypothetical protein
MQTTDPFEAPSPNTRPAGTRVLSTSGNYSRAFPFMEAIIAVVTPPKPKPAMTKPCTRPDLEES